MKVSFDPGQKWGCCVWLKGKPVALHTIKTYRATYPERRAHIWNQLVMFLDDWQEQTGEPITEFAIEAFQEGYSLNIKQTRKLENLKGYVIHGLEHWNSINHTPIHEVSKGTAPKRQAKILAKQFRLEGDGDAMDALHIGCLAGWLK
jgi:hypothetical protein